MSSSLPSSTLLTSLRARADYMAAYDLAASTERHRQLLALMRSPCREASHAAALTWAVSADIALMNFTVTVNLGNRAWRPYQPCRRRRAAAPQH